MTHRDRMIQKAGELQVGTYLQRFVAKDFQLMVRAEAGASEDAVLAYQDMIGACVILPSPLGQAVCVTCGDCRPWTHDKKAGGVLGLDSGHYVCGRGASYVLQETNCHPQCVLCNKHNYGQPERYRAYMLARYGIEEIERLEDLKRKVICQYTREEMVDLRIGFRARIKKARRVMSC